MRNASLQSFALCSHSSVMHDNTLCIVYLLKKEYGSLCVSDVFKHVGTVVVVL